MNAHKTFRSAADNSFLTGLPGALVYGISAKSGAVDAKREPWRKYGCKVQ